MHKKAIIFTALLFSCIGGTIISRINLSASENLKIEHSDNHEMKSEDILDYITTEKRQTTESGQYSKYINVQATEHMPNLSFELTGKIEEDDYYTNFYYPVKLVIKTDAMIIQEIEFNKDDFAPCTLDTFDFEYGDFKFDGYGGFKILSTSMGKNPSYYFWVWDKNENSFVSYTDLEIMGYITFDYNNKLINISNTGSASYHEFTTYKYVNDKLILIKKVVDADSDGYRKVYELKNSELELIEITESHLKG